MRSRSHLGVRFKLTPEVLPYEVGVEDGDKPKPWRPVKKRGKRSCETLNSASPMKTKRWKQDLRLSGNNAQMPPLATSAVDEDGMALIEAWVESLQ